MGFFQRAKKTVKPFINITRWLDMETLLQNGRGIAELARKLFIPAKATYREDFEQAVQRLDLSENDIQQRIKQFSLYARVFFSCTLLLLGYIIYLMAVGAFMAFFASFGLMMVTLGQAFRYHFWAYQMKQRRLGCRFSDWFKHSLKRIKK